MGQEARRPTRWKRASNHLAGWDPDSTMRPEQIWPEQCEAALDIHERFGNRRALDYLVGEKFVRFLAAAASEPGFKAQVPAFAARIKILFEPYDLAEWFRAAKEPRASVDDAYDQGHDVDGAADEIEDGLRRMYLLEDAQKWLL